MRIDFRGLFGLFTTKKREEIIMGKPVVSDKDFVIACAKNANVEAIISATGLKRATIMSRAKKLRKLGVCIPEFSRQKKIIDIKGLNDLIGGKVSG
jgi:hypothetical protein